MYAPEVDEIVRVRGLRGKWRFKGYGRDGGGDYVVLFGALKANSYERLTYPDRVIPIKRRKSRTMSSNAATRNA